MPRWFTRPQAVTQPSTNRAQCRLTTLIEANALTTTLRRHPMFAPSYELQDLDRESQDPGPYTHIAHARMQNHARTYDHARERTSVNVRLLGAWTSVDACRCSCTQ